MDVWEYSMRHVAGTGRKFAHASDLKVSQGVWSEGLPSVPLQESRAGHRAGAIGRRRGPRPVPRRRSHMGAIGRAFKLRHYSIAACISSVQRHFEIVVLPWARSRSRSKCRIHPPPDNRSLFASKRSAIVSSWRRGCLPQSEVWNPALAREECAAVDPTFGHAVAGL
jgi:hypothetical protein